MKHGQKAWIKSTQHHKDCGAYKHPTFPTQTCYENQRPLYLGGSKHVKNIANPKTMLQKALCRPHSSKTQIKFV